jgi:PPOX class probable F420-dependent enzyme
MALEKRNMLDLTTEFGKRAGRRLNAEQVIWLTTVRKDAMPQPVPVWFWWDGETALIFTRPGSHKLRNLEHNAKAALHLDSDGRGGDIIVLEGEAEVLAGQMVPTDVQPYMQKYQDGLERIGMTAEAFAHTYLVPIRFTPNRIRGH